MKAIGPLHIEIPKHATYTLDPSPNRATSPNRVSPEERSMQAIDLAVKNTPMTVPAISIQKPSKHTTQRDIELLARRPSENVLVDEHGSTYDLQPVIIAGSFGAVRIGIKRDPVVDQRFMFKELARVLAAPLESPSPRTNKNTMGLRPFDEDLLRTEVDLMLKVDSPLAPQVVLKTDDRYFVGMPPLEGDMLDAVNYISNEHPHLLSTLTRVLIRDVAKMLVKLDANDVSHRDIKLENVLYTHTGEMFLADYGLGEDHVKVVGLSGTPLYFSPEAFASMRVNWEKGNIEEKPYNGKKADIYSLGMAALQALVVANENPFELDCFYDGTLRPAALMSDDFDLSPLDVMGLVETSLREVNENLSDFAQSAQTYRLFLKSGPQTEFPRTSNPHFDAHFRQGWRKSPSTLEIIVDMLEVDPSKRLSAADIVERMKDPKLAVTASEQRELGTALAQRPKDTQADSGYGSAGSSNSSRLVSRNNTAV